MMMRGVLKTSTIRISAGETDAVYRSLKEMPAALRRRLLRSTNSVNSATILIADRRGRQELVRAIQNLSFERRSTRPPAAGWRLRPAVKAALAGLVGAAGVLAGWFLFLHR
jgi:hypothetical protein